MTVVLTYIIAFFFFCIAFIQNEEFAQSTWKIHRTKKKINWSINWMKLRNPTSRTAFYAFLISFSILLNGLNGMKKALWETSETHPYWRGSRKEKKIFEINKTEKKEKCFCDLVHWTIKWHDFMFKLYSNFFSTR